MQMKKHVNNIDLFLIICIFLLFVFIIFLIFIYKYQ